MCLQQVDGSQISPVISFSVVVFLLFLDAVLFSELASVHSGDS